MIGLRRTRRRTAGFTLLEVMLALALLALGLVALVKSAANSIFSTQQAHMLGVATNLARGKMYELEEKLIKDGFSDLEEDEENQPFTEEGWPTILYSYKIEAVELPSFDQLQALTKAQCGEGSGSAGSADGSGSDASGCGFENSALGGMLSGLGGFGGGGGDAKGGEGDVNAANGAAFIQGQYQMFQQILKVSIRKVTLTLNWQVMGSDRDMKVVAYFTDAAAMDKVLSGLGAEDLDDRNARTGSGSGTGSGTGTSGGTGGGTGGGGRGGTGGGRGSGGIFGGGK